MSDWTYAPSHHVPFRDVEALERCRAITRAAIENHPNPDFRIRVMPAEDIGFLWVSDMFRRIAAAAEAGERLVMILPNPAPAYRHVARLVNMFRVDCSHVWAFAMDEYADENGSIAPESWEFGFVHAMKNYFWSRIDEDLRPPENQMIGPGDDNIDRYGEMITDMGEADICYSGPGWTGHLAFIEPDAPEFDAPLEEWREMGPRVCTLSPFTLAQNSLHGSFGMSGDLAAVPPKAATIGPAQVVRSKRRIDVSSITVHGSGTSWQRLMTRLVAHGPVTPRLPTSIHQTLRTDFYISENNARNIEPDWEKGY